MKKQLLVAAIAASISGSMAASSVSELSTTVYNKSDRDIWISWASASFIGRAISAAKEVAYERRWVLIEAGDNLEVFHTGDRLMVRTYTCRNGSLSVLKEEKNATVKGYEVAVVTPSESGIEIKIGKKDILAEK